MSRRIIVLLSVNDRTKETSTNTPAAERGLTLTFNLHLRFPAESANLGRDKDPMDKVGDLQDNIRPLNVFGGNFTDVKGDHYHIRGNFLNRELEPGRGE